MQLFLSDTVFMYVVPMKNKTQIIDAVKQFAKEIGVPLSLILDPEGTHRGDKLEKAANEMDLALKFLERKTQWANLTELYIGLLKEAVRYDMHGKDNPMVFWDYCAERRALINNLTAKNLFQLEGSNANMKILGDSGDISNLCQFDWFDWCKYRDSSQFPRQEMRLGRVLGPAQNLSNEMAQ